MNGFTETAAGWIFSILLNSLWEGAAIALAAAVVLRLVSRTNATTRASILAAALIASITLPVATTIASRPRATTPVAGVRHVAVQLPRVHTAAREGRKRQSAPDGYSPPSV